MDVLWIKISPKKKGHPAEGVLIGPFRKGRAKTFKAAVVSALTHIVKPTEVDFEVELEHMCSKHCNYCGLH